MRTVFVVTLRVGILILASSALLALGISPSDSTEVIGSMAAAGRWDCLSRSHRPEHAGPSQHLLVNQETGFFHELRLPDDVCWDLVNLAPWRDPRGSLVAVSRWNDHRPHTGDSYCGLARIRVPDGQVLDQVSVDKPPISRPCWMPGRPDVVIYAAGDGMLYRHDFSEPSRYRDTDATSIDTTRPVAWNCPLPASDRVFLSEPHWPSEPEAHGLLFVNLKRLSARKGEKSDSRGQIWCLALDSLGTSIIGAAPIQKPDPEQFGSEHGSPRYPTLAIGQGGKTDLVYLDQQLGTPVIRLVSQSLEIGLDRSGDPQVRTKGRVRVLTDHCALIPPLVNTRGSSVLAVLRDLHTIRRFPLHGAEGGRRSIDLAAK